jgi:hypothetical protein
MYISFTVFSLLRPYHKVVRNQCFTIDNLISRLAHYCFIIASAIESWDMLSTKDDYFLVQTTIQSLI